MAPPALSGPTSETVAGLPFGSLNTLIMKYSDLFVAVLVVLVVGMMIVPLPTWLLDILLTIQITIAVIILLSALYISDALKMASFPTMLLLTTLYRLALNISTTRLILAQ